MGAFGRTASWDQHRIGTRGKHNHTPCKCLRNVTPLWDTMLMLIEAARRAETAAKEMLAIVNEGSAPCAELRQMLEVSKATMAIMSAAQVSAAADVAGRERHGDGGAEVLACGCGAVAAGGSQPGEDRPNDRGGAQVARSGRVGSGVGGQRQTARGSGGQDDCR